MRVTNHMLSTGVLRNLSSSLREFQRVSNQMSSGNAVSRPSDNPVIVSRIMTLKSNLAAQERYHGNMTDAENFLNTTDDALDHVTETLLRVRELIGKGGTGTLSPSDRQAVAHEVDQLIDQLMEVGNSMCGSQYIFGGHTTSSAPLSREGDIVTYSGDSGVINYELGRGVTMGINIQGEALFVGIPAEDVEEGKGNTQLFNLLVDVKNSLEKGEDVGKLTDEFLEECDRLSDHVLAQRAIVGAKEKRVEMGKARNEGDKIEIVKVLSYMQDIDLAEVSMQYSERAYAYQAALITASQMLSISLVDYVNR